MRRHYDTYGSDPFLTFAPPGHFYSPLPDLAYVERHKATLFDRGISSVPGIDTNAQGQLAIIDKLSAHYSELPFKPGKSAALRYYFDDPYFSYGDAIILYAMLRHLQSRRVIEVGSGFSSAVMLDTNDMFLERRTALTFIEPYPNRLLSLLTDEDKRHHEVIADAVQNVPLERFDALGAGDILFVDSSHVAKIGSDVVHLLTSVLPRLAPGVFIHFHDVFWPFEYPEDWIQSGRAWNENYVLKAFLQFNEKFRIVCFSSYLAIHHSATMAQKLPLFMKNSGGSLWLEKL